MTSLNDAFVLKDTVDTLLLAGARQAWEYANGLKLKNPPTNKAAELEQLEDCLTRIHSCLYQTVRDEPGRVKADDKRVLLSTMLKLLGGADYIFGEIQRALNEMAPAERAQAESDFEQRLVTASDEFRTCATRGAFAAGEECCIPADSDSQPILNPEMCSIVAANETGTIPRIITENEFPTVIEFYWFLVSGSTPPIMLSRLKTEMTAHEIAANEDKIVVAALKNFPAKLTEPDFITQVEMPCPRIPAPSSRPVKQAELVTCK